MSNGRIGAISKAVVHVMSAREALAGVSVTELEMELGLVENSLRSALEHTRQGMPAYLRATNSEQAALKRIGE